MINRSVRFGLCLCLLSISIFPSSSASGIVVRPGTGPNGEIPQAGVSRRVVEQLAAGENISVADADFVMGVGGRALSDFSANFDADQRFGAVWVEYSPFSVHLRTTQPAPDLSSRLTNDLGRAPQVTVGGLSKVEFRKLEVKVSQVLDSAGRKTGRPLRAESDSDSRFGTVGIRVNPADRRLIENEVLPVGVDVRDGDVEVHQPSSFAGAGMSDCTVGFAATQALVNRTVRGVVTAGHCPNSGQTAYGYPLNNAQQEICSYSDRQLHVTSAPNLYWGFYDYFNVWSTIQAVAGGYYRGQPFHRRGRYSVAAGIVGDPQYVPFGGNPTGQDCGNYMAYVFPLFNSAGGLLIGGDSGGPLMLIYNGQYYLAGITTGAGSPNNGNPTNGWAAWRDIPAGWIPCTAQNQCT
jgi:hypothetical protein